MKPKVFTVEGSGEFPKDMLRYDMCAPLSEEDTAKVEAGYDTHPYEALKRRRVTLTSTLPSAPTYRRWESFLWKVVEGELDR